MRQVERERAIDELQEESTHTVESVYFFSPPRGARPFISAAAGPQVPLREVYALMYIYFFFTTPLPPIFCHHLLHYVNPPHARDIEYFMKLTLSTVTFAFIETRGALIYKSHIFII